MTDQRSDDPIVQDILTARQINRALGTTIGPWDVGQLDEALIAAILRTLQPAPSRLPIAPEIERRKQQIRTEYWARFGMRPPVYH